MQSPSTRLAGKVAIVTGAAQGIGRTYALGLAAAGAKICACDIADTAETVRLVQAAGGEAIGARVDVTSDSDLDAVVTRTLEAFGRVDVLVNNAALFANLRMRNFTEIDPAEWDRVMAVNVRGCWQAAKAVTPAMARSGGGSIVNIASATAFKGSAFLLHYVTSKGAVLALTKSLAREAAAHNIRVNAVAPGLVLSEQVVEHADWREAATAIVASRALKRDSQPEDLIGAVVFLASEESAFVTGQTLVVDGGSIMH
ncbi:NAD(P)-dependent dehydrogenase, short-chain alcohol dehydrogenase family [Variovorax sp. HW608]|uniref:SDR family NAD(P)-dependent oxidoreductase n=1 Tax=Variovorax sp. HW608 TaxID=1034889 RepID=UPI00081FFE92|nr:glucose 1-dehydrogenase [Variovorax sp. HW608]SCK14753.1 NAD(P)-dependent dehydrogenase, short-chain alcohol dehydrogenase family [Variovorax sp. HW608]